MKQYIELEDDEVVDTKKIIKHVECYHIKEDELIQENIDGSEYILGKVKRNN